MGKLYRLAHMFAAEILGIDTRIKRGAAHIYRIGTAVYRRPQRFK